MPLPKVVCPSRTTCETSSRLRRDNVAPTMEYGPMVQLAGTIAPSAQSLWDEYSLDGCLGSVSRLFWVTTRTSWHITVASQTTLPSTSRYQAS